MTLEKRLIASTDAADIWLYFPTEKSVNEAFGVDSPAQMEWDTFLKEEIDPFVPSLRGVLRQSVTYGHGQLIYDTVYARFLYYGKVMVDPVTGSPFARRETTKVVVDRDLQFNGAPQRGAFWDRRANNDRMDAWQRKYLEIRMRGLGAR